MSEKYNWVMDTFASEDVIDSYFIVSELEDITLSEAEACESAYYDSLAEFSLNEGSIDPNIPLGKLVI